MNYDKTKYIEITDDPSVNTSKLYANLKNKFGAQSFWKKKGLDQDFPAPKEKTVRYFKKQKDPDLLGFSANDMKDTPTMTLREYMIFFEKYKEETGEYPDEKLQTITSSRTSRSTVASAGFNGYMFFANWNYVGTRYRDTGGREVVIPEPSPLGVDGA